MPQPPSIDNSAGGDEPSPLEQLLESWFLKLENGERPDIDEHCREHPELEADFRRMIGFAADFDGIINQQPATSDSKPGGGEASKTAPAMLGEFELIAPLGAGGGGEVYLARQTSLRRMVAVKRLRTSEDERSRQRLRREAEVAASLDHPGIVPIYAVGEDAGDAWIAMKWLTGPALDGIDAPLSPREVARIGAAAARALHEAHTAGIVHR
ncbi:MAG: protein kinase, partial [Planctomycetota bacterium]